MTELRIKEARALHNERLRAKNIKEGKPETEGFVSSSILAMHIYSWEEYQEKMKKQKKEADFESYRNSANTSMTALNRGAMQKVSIPWIPKMCFVLGIDANFLFGLPSVHDKDYEELVLNKK